MEEALIDHAFSHELVAAHALVEAEGHDSRSLVPQIPSGEKLFEELLRGPK